MFKVNNKDTRTTSMTYDSIANFEQVNVGWVIIIIIIAEFIRIISNVFNLLEILENV